MKASALKYGILTLTASCITLILLLIPFHAFISVWLASNYGHYTAFRLWKEVLLGIATLGAIYLTIFDKKVRLSTLYHELTWLILAYCAVQLIWAAAALHYHQVTPLAAAYGLLINIRFLVVLLVAWAVGARTKRLRAHWSKLLIWPALIVIGFGLLQIFVLPTDFLRHFGYSAKTIYPFETINHNPNYVRIMSTLRGANPLGAYLILPISALVTLMTIGKRNWRRWLMLLAAAIVLFYSFSRSAWIGASLSVLFIGLLRLPRRYRKRLAALAAASLGVIVVLAVGLHNNQRFQNIILHTQTHSAVAATSDGGHLSALRSGLHDIVHEPLGRGPGTAGPASFYNAPHPVRIAENYYVQIGQETGWLGLGLFLAINLFMAWLLWQRRGEPLSLVLLASLVGISFVNLLSHAWTDDTLSYLWWGLAGIAIGSGAKKPTDNEVPKPQA